MPSVQECGETLLKHMTPCAESLGVGGGVTMDFVVKSLVRNGHPFDLDNLCEPVFWALCSAGAFGGTRGGIGWWNATRRVGSPEGCHVAIHAGHSRPLPDGPPVIRAEFPGPLPRRATDTGMLLWASSIRAEALPDGTLTLLLVFGGRINIGDICTGRVKNVIDCLMPWLGGSVGRPADHRISSLFVQRRSDQPESHVKVAMWHAPATNEVEAGRAEQDGCSASMNHHADASLREELDAARARVRLLEAENEAMRERPERVEAILDVREHRWSVKIGKTGNSSSSREVIAPRAVVHRHSYRAVSAQFLQLFSTFCDLMIMYPGKYSVFQR